MAAWETSRGNGRPVPATMTFLRVGSTAGERGSAVGVPSGRFHGADPAPSSASASNS